LIQAGPQRRDILGGGLQSPGSVRPGTTGPTAAPGQQQHEQPRSRLLPTLAKTDWQLAFLLRQLSPASRAILPLLGQSTKARGQRTAEAAITRDRLASEQLEISCGPASSQDPRHSRQAPQPSPRLRANGPSREWTFPRTGHPEPRANQHGRLQQRRNDGAAPLFVQACSGNDNLPKVKGLAVLDFHFDFATLASLVLADGNA